MSLPLPPDDRVGPSPPLSRSLPSSPLSESASSPPFSRSLPARPRRQSSPSPPFSTSLPLPPTSRSPNSEPVSVSAGVVRVLPVGAAARGGIVVADGPERDRAPQPRTARADGAQLECLVRLVGRVAHHRDVHERGRLPARDAHRRAGHDVVLAGRRVAAGELVGHPHLLGDRAAGEGDVEARGHDRRCRPPPRRRPRRSRSAAPPRRSARRSSRRPARPGTAGSSCSSPSRGT